MVLILWPGYFPGRPDENDKSHHSGTYYFLCWRQWVSVEGGTLKKYNSRTVQLVKLWDSWTYWIEDETWKVFLLSCTCISRHVHVSWGLLNFFFLCLVTDRVKDRPSPVLDPLRLSLIWLNIIITPNNSYTYYCVPIRTLISRSRYTKFTNM